MAVCVTEGSSGSDRGWAENAMEHARRKLGRGGGSTPLAPVLSNTKCGQVNEHRWPLARPPTAFPPPPFSTP
jgi:hypothetical protein